MIVRSDKHTVRPINSFSPPLWSCVAEQTILFEDFFVQYSFQCLLFSIPVKQSQEHEHSHSCFGSSTFLAFAAGFSTNCSLSMNSIASSFLTCFSATFSTITRAPSMFTHPR
jgi:hypothetical protein